MDVESQTTDRSLARPAQSAATLLPTNGVLIDRYLKRGDQTAFAELVRRFGPMVLGVSRKLLSFQEDADDATQIVFAELARRAGTIEDPAFVGSWLHTITVRVALRLRQRRPSTKPLVADPIDPRLSLDDVGRRSDLEVLSEELEDLPEAWREPLLMRYFTGLSNEEAARQLGTTEKAYEGRLKRGRNCLRVRLLRRGVGTTAVLAMVGPAAVPASADCWQEFADASLQLSSDPTSLTFLPPESKPMVGTIITTKAVAALSAAVVVLGLVAGDRLSTSPVPKLLAVSTLVADDSPEPAAAAVLTIENAPSEKEDAAPNAETSAVSELTPPPMVEILYFRADWDPVSRRMDPAIASISEHMTADVLVTEVNADRQPELLRQYQITALPTFVALQDGKQVDRTVGYLQTSGLLTFIESVAHQPTGTQLPDVSVVTVYSAPVTQLAKDPRQLAAALAELLGDDSTVVYSEARDSLIVRTDRTGHSAIKSLLASLAPAEPDAEFKDVFDPRRNAVEPESMRGVYVPITPTPLPGRTSPTGPRQELHTIVGDQEVIVTIDNLGRPVVRTKPLPQPYEPQSVLPDATADLEETIAAAPPVKLPLAEGRYLIIFTQANCETSKKMESAILETIDAFPDGRVIALDANSVRGKATATALGVDLVKTPTVVIASTHSAGGDGHIPRLIDYGMHDVESLVAMLMSDRIIERTEQAREDGTPIPGREEDAAKLDADNYSPRVDIPVQGGFF